MLRTARTPALQSLGRVRTRFPLGGVRWTSTIPGPSGPEEWLSFGNPLSRNTEVVSNMQRKYGDIVKLPASCLGIEMVYVSHPADIQSVFQKEGKYPIAIGASLFANKYWDDKRAQRDGDTNMLGFASGEEWKELRNRLQKPIFNPRDVASLVPGVAELSAKAMEVFADRVKERGLGLALSQYTIDTITDIMVGKPIGLSSPNPPPPGSKHANYCADFHAATEKVMLLMTNPAAAAAFHASPGNTPEYKAVEEAFDGFFDQTLSMLQDCTATLREGSGPAFERAAGSFVGRLIAGGDLGERRFAASVTNFIMAGMDTTSHSLQWLIWHLASNPSRQEELRQAVYDIVGGGRGRVVSPLTQDHYASAQKAARAYLKESMRLTPSIMGTARALTEDITLGREGYTVSAGTFMQLMPSNYTTDPRVWGEDAGTFRPSRWGEIPKGEQQEDPHDVTPALRSHPYLQMSFGKGPRMCIGQRLVDIEVTCMMSELLQRYEIALPEGAPVEVANNTSDFVGRPDPEPEYTFTPIA